MAFGAKKSSPIKGYRDLFKDEMAGAESTEGQKDYHRPTRKPPLDPSVFPRASAPANILSNKKGLNPLSLAMRDERVPRSRIPFVRPQASLPPSYLSKLRYSQSEWKMEIKSFEAINSTKKSQSPSDIVRLSFDSAVEEKRAPGKYLMHHPSSVYSDRSLPILSKEAKDSYTNSSHQQKDQLDLSNAPLDFTPSSFASQQQPNRTTTAAADNNETQTPYSTRNVPFMLEIWQKTEGVDLDKMMQQEQDNARFQRVKMSQKVEALARDKGFDLKENDLVKRAIHRKQALAEQQYLTDLNNATVVTEPQTRDEVVHQLADTLTTITDSPATSVSLSSTAKSRRLVAPFAVGVAMDALAEEPTGETTTQEVFESHENGHRPLSSVDQASNKVPNLVSNTSTSKLSKSTLKVLQKLSQDHPTTASRINLLDQYDVLPNPESKIRFTLMGPESAQTLTEMPMYSLSNGAKSLQPISVARKRGVSMYTPGAYNQLLQSSFDAHGEIIVLHDDPKDENQQRRESKGNFRLTLPEFVGTHSRSSLGSELESDKDDELQEAFLSLENPLLNMTPIDLIYGPNETNDELGSTADFYPPALTRETSQQHSIPLSAVQRRLSLFSRRLSVIANQNNNQKKPMLSFAELKSLAEEKKIAARLASGKKYFCLSRFNEFGKSFI